MPVTGENSLMFQMGADTSGLAKGATGAVGIVQRLASTVAKINPFAALAVGALAVFGAVANAAFDFAKRYELAMLEVKTISQATRSDFDGIRSAIFKLSTETLDDPIKLAQAYYQIVSAGYDGAAGLKLLETASKAATAGVTTTEVAADGITTVLNAFKLSASQAGEVADVMFKTVELGKTTFDQLAASVSQVAPLAASMSLSMEEVFAAVASLTKQGVPTAQAMTQIRSALIGVNETLGDGWGNAYSLQEAFQAVYDKAGGSQMVLKEYIGRIEGVNAILATAGSNAQNAAKDLEALEDAAGAAGAAFDIMASGQINQMEVLGNRVRAVTELMGNQLLEYANDIAGLINDMTSSDVSFAESVAQKEARDFQDLSLQIKDATGSLERRKEIWEDMQNKYPAILGNLEWEGELTNDMVGGMMDVNHQLKLRIQYEKEKAEANDASIALAEAQRVKEQAKLDLLQRIASVENAKYDDVRRAMESRYGRELNWLEKVNILTSKMFGNQFAGIAKMKNEFVDANKKVLELGKTYQEVAGRMNKTSAIMKGFDLNPEDFVRGAYDYETDLENQKDALKKKKTAYETYEAYVVQFGKDAADERYKILIAEGANYEAYLRRRIILAQNAAEKEALALAAGTEKALANRDDDKWLVLQQQGFTWEQEARNAPPLELGVELGLKDVNAVEKELDRLQTAMDKAMTQSARDQIRVLIETKQKEIEIMRGSAEDQKSIWDDLNTYRKDLSIGLLRAELKSTKAKYKEEKKAHGKFSKEALEAQAEMRLNQDALVDRITEQAQRIGQIFSGIGDIFDKLGNEEMSRLMNQLGELANASGTLAAGIVSGDPLAIISGAVEFIKAGLTVEIVSDTAKFEKQIERLEEAIEKLDYAISQSVGIDKISNRKEAIDQLRELEQAAARAEEAERKARKEVKFLGIGLGDKGEGSGTDPEKLEELQRAAEDARREVTALAQEIDELYTGTTQSSIVDSIVSGFEEGKTAAADFADTFEDLMRQAVVESLKMRYLEKAVDAFFKDFADKAESGDELSATEIAQLEQSFNNMIAQSARDLEQLNAILQSAGIDMVGATAAARQGLQGEIQTVTEDTANMLAGTLNKIMLDVAQGLEVGLASLTHLSEINARMASLLDVQEEASIKLTNIEKALT